MSKRILFITTANLSTNPRLLKEVLFLKNKGVECEILAFYLGSWYDNNDKLLNKEYNLKVNYLSATRKDFFSWLYYSLLHKYFQKIWTAGKSLKHTAFASNKRSIQLMDALNSKKEKFDYIIAHNQGALFPAYHFSRKKKIPFGFDVEDYHPGETIDFDGKNEKLRREHLFKLLLPKANYVSFASPFIMEETLKLVALPKEKRIYIQNSSFKDEFISPIYIDNEKLLMVWFSQNITFNRGLEQFLAAADNFTKDVEVTLIGNLNKDFYERELKHRYYLHIKKPLNQIQLHHELAKYDVGLAIEIGAVDLNKEICISNKIFAYAQAGLYILATDTKGQAFFIMEQSNRGMLTKQNINGFTEKIEELIKNKYSIRNDKNSRYKKAISLSYDNELEKLIEKLF